MHGVKIKDRVKHKKTDGPIEYAPTGDNTALGFQMFKEPDAYKNMSDTEKQELTNRMMGVHQQWAGKTNVSLGSKTPIKKVNHG